MSAELSALESELSQRMASVKLAKLATRALQWLDTYGDSAARDRDLRFEVRMSFASSCEGANEAASYIEIAAEKMAALIVESARKQARSEIDLALKGGDA